MSELLTASLTIIGGVIIYVLGQIIDKFFIEPVYEQSKLIGEIADSLIFYANVISNPGFGSDERQDEASRVFRQQASQLMARTHAIPWYKFMEFLKIVPRRGHIVTARTNLIGLSNSLKTERLSDSNDKRKEQIEKSLGIKI